MATAVQDATSWVGTKIAQKLIPEGIARITAFVLNAQQVGYYNRDSDNYADYTGYGKYLMLMPMKQPGAAFMDGDRVERAKNPMWGVFWNPLVKKWEVQEYKG